MLVSWGGASDVEARGRSKLLRRFRMGLAAAAVWGVALELPHCFYRAPEQTIETLGVVGDSITAGLNDGEDTWPQQLARRVTSEVVDASQPGATLKSARKQLQLLEPSGVHALVLEIGGNDLLEGLPVPEFEHDLDQLLSDCRDLNPAVVVMFELPLPPLATRYGAVQRRVAALHGVKLVPRRVLAGVLTANGSTVDGIHLSNAGQTRLAGVVQKLLKFENAPSQSGNYRRLEPQR